jgi:diguanylate cyclase (GGDEF)-like protein
VVTAWEKQVLVARKALGALSWLLVIAGIGLGAVSSSLDATQRQGALLGAFAVAALALLLGSVLNRAPLLPVLISLLAIGLVLGNNISGIDLVLNELFLLGAHTVVVIGLAILLRSRLRSDARNVTADGLIVGLGAWLIVWVVLIEPSVNYLNNTGLTTAHGLSLGVAMIVLFLLATLVFSDSTPSVSLAFISGAIALFLVGTIVKAVALRGNDTISNPTVDAPFVMALIILAAGFMHPTVRTLQSPGVTRVSPPLMTRLVLTTASLIAPIITLALTDANSTADRIVRTVSACVLAIMVMARVVQSVRGNSLTQQRLVRSALTDSLTGLPNRVLMLEHIDAALTQAWRTNKQPTVLFIDVDRFKNINDSLGHSTGDTVLTHVASRLLLAVPPHATVARIAGDEFVILDPQTESPTQSVVLAEQILDAFREPMNTHDGDMFITGSIGVAYAPRGMHITADELMRHADTAMYRAKDAGRNCIALFDESMLETVTKRLEVETALYRALERKELHMVHQPIIDIDLGVVVGFEALMRWDRAELGVVSPAEFIPIAEETGTIVPLGSWALNDALSQLRTWIDSVVCTPSTTMSVNVSARQLHDPQFVTVVRDALAASRISPEQLILEVTESVMITEPTQALASLERLNSLGVRIAIDDFGTGYSSLSLLQRFPVQSIKIDRSFVSSIVTQEDTRSIVRTIIAMAKTLGADIVAEGVEDAAQLAVLASMSCSKAQGYLISRPIQVADVPRVVRELQDLQHWRTITSTT